MPEKKRYRVRKTDADGRPVGALSYPTDPEVEAALRKAGVAGGEAARVAREEAEAAGKIKTVKAGDYCDDVPAKSLTWLLAQKLVEQVDDKRDLQQPRKDT